MNAFDKVVGFISEQSGSFDVYNFRNVDEEAMPPFADLGEFLEHDGVK